MGSNNDITGKPPAESHTVSPYLVVTDASELITFLKIVFGAEEKISHRSEDGTITHAEMILGDSIIMLGQTDGSEHQASALLHIYVKDVDSVYKRAISSGATPVREPEDRDFGSRQGAVKDRFGNQWWISSQRT